MKTKHGTTTNAKDLQCRIDTALTQIGAEMTLDEALAYLQAHHAVLVYSDGLRSPIDVWSTEKLPLQPRRLVRVHGLALAERMRRGDVLTCPTPLHRKFRKGGICRMCAHLEPALEQGSSGSVVCSS